MVTWRGHLVAMVTEQDKNREETLEDRLRRTTRLGLTWPPDSSDLSPASVGCAEQRSDQRRRHLHLASRAASTGPKSGPSKNEMGHTGHHSWARSLFIKHFHQEGLLQRALA